jgi:hypothetical protein
MSDPSIQTDSLHCPDCGYNLFGIESARCPECGLAIDRSILGDSRIPWMHRRRIGRIRAFWRTVVLATLHPKIIAQEVNRTVGYADAIKFRRVCLLLAILGCLPVIVLMVIEMPMLRWEAVGLAVVCEFSVWLYLLCITGLPSLFFRPNALPVLRQNRAVALSFYTVAPLTAMIVPIGILCVSILMLDGPNRWISEGETLIVVGFALLMALLAAHGTNSFILLKHATHCSAARRWIMDVCLVSAWLILAYVVLIGIPAIAIYVAVVVQSLI